MQYSTLILAVFPLLALAAPATLSHGQQKEGIQAAAENWQADTSTVSNFLDSASSLNKSTTLLSQGKTALGAEKDELLHKAILDTAFVNITKPLPAVVNAKNQLEAGAFQAVVDKLQDISITGNLKDVSDINLNRCANVLPAIDAYFKAVAHATGNKQLFAQRPHACGPTGVL